MIDIRRRVPPIKNGEHRFQCFFRLTRLQECGLISKQHHDLIVVLTQKTQRADGYLRVIRVNRLQNRRIKGHAEKLIPRVISVNQRFVDRKNRGIRTLDFRIMDQAFPLKVRIYSSSVGTAYRFFSACP